MNDYIELPTSEIELDVSNPRIARGVAYYGTSSQAKSWHCCSGLPPKLVAV